MGQTNGDGKCKTPDENENAEVETFTYQTPDGTIVTASFTQDTENHIIYGEGIGKQQRGVSGAHNKDHFIQTLKNTGHPMENLLIGDPIPHPTIPGIFEQKYTIPAYDGIIKKDAPKGKFLGYKNIKEPKTYYDPTQIIDTEMVQAEKDVMRNGTLKGSRKVVGTTLLKGEEIKFEAYIKDGKFSTIYPTLKE